MVPSFSNSSLTLCCIIWLGCYLNKVGAQSDKQTIPQFTETADLAAHLEDIQQLIRLDDQFYALLELTELLSSRMNPYTVRYIDRHLQHVPADDPRVAAAVQYLLGEFYNVNLQRYQEALAFYQQAHEYLPTGHSRLKLHIVERVALLSLDQGYLAAAMTATDTCVAVAQRYDCWFSLANCQRCKGIIRERYFQEDPREIDMYRGALEHFKMALQASREKQDTTAMLLDLFYVANSIQQIESTWEASEEYIREAFQLIQPPDSTYLDFWAQNAYLLAKLRAEEEKYDIAEALFAEAYQLFAKNEDLTRMIQVNLERAQLLFQQQQYPAALRYLQLAQELAPENLPWTISRDIHYLLSRTFEALDRPAEALQAFKQYDLAKDSLVKIAKGRLVIAAAAEREREKQEEELAQQEVQLQNRLWATLLLAGVLFFALVTLIMLIIYSRRVRKDRNTLAERNAIIQDQHRRLAELNMAKTQFFTNVSHELRTPLTLILAPLRRVIDRQKLSLQDNKLLQTVERNATTLQQLVDELLDINRIESGKALVSAKPTLLNLFLQQLVEAFRPLAEAQQVALSTQLSTSEDLILHLDQEHLKKIINNLLSNAIKYSPQQSTIVLSTQYTPEALHIKVQDSGLGIYTDDLPFIFDRFYRSRHADARVDGSSGIGLAICSELTKLMGGRLEVISERGKGSSFELIFPREAFQQRSSDTKAVPPPASVTYEAVTTAAASSLSPNVRPTILIVEDHDDMRDYLADLLAESYEVVAVRHGQEAVDILNQPDHPLLKPGNGLIISDMMMPVMNGQELLQYVKSHQEYAWIPIIMLTALQNLNDRIRALTIGVDDYLVKPFHNEELLVRVHNLLHRYQNRSLPVEEEMLSITPDQADSEQRYITPVLDDLEPEQYRWLKQLEAYALDNLENSQFGVSFLSRHVDMSDRTFQRRIKKLTGLKPSEYIKELRLNRALWLLQTKQVASVKDAARVVGFQQTEYFSDLFLQRFGRRPSTYLHD